MIGVGARHFETWLVWMACFLGMFLGADARAATLELSQAQATVTVNGATTLNLVKLPYHWDRLHPGQPGTATFVLNFSARELIRQPGDLLRAYFLRLGNTYEVSLNGQLVERNGDLQQFNGDDYALIPRYIDLPTYLLKAENALEIRIKADSGRRAGVPRVVLGSPQEIAVLYQPAYFWRVTGSEIVVILSLFFAALSLALWLTQVDANPLTRSRRDPLYLFAGLAELAWALRVGTAMVEQPLLPWAWWGTLNALALGTWVCFMLRFCWMVAGWSEHRLAKPFFRLLWAFLAVGSVAAYLSFAVRQPVVLTVWYVSLSLVVVPFTLVFLRATMRQPTFNRVALSTALLLNVYMGLRDWYVFRLGDSFGSNTLTRYSAMVFGLILACIVMARFREASRQARDLLAHMATRITEKESELAQSYQVQEGLAREQERTTERSRILRDMHDGVGAHISTAIRQLESGRFSQDDLLQTLRDSLDQLKLSVDALHLPAGDITALLANLRYRLEPRFKASNIRLQWNVSLLEPLSRLSHLDMKNLQFMVFEALSNVLQHARASMLRIDLHATSAGGAQLQVIDDGCGFDPDAVSRRGLLSLRERAAALGASLEVSSVPGKTVVQITLN